MDIILAVEGEEDGYQPIGEAASMDEAIEMARDYLAHASPDEDLAPYAFIAWQRDLRGYFTQRTEIKL